MSGSELPQLPRIDGDMDLMLDVYTHPSLLQQGAQMRDDYGDIYRLRDLGAKVFEMAVTYHLFAKKPSLRVEEIESERTKFLSEEQAYDWVTSYGLKGKLRIAITEISLLDDAKEMQNYFHTYIGALYIRNGHGPLLQNWISKLIDPGYIADVVLPAEGLKLNTQPNPPAYSSASTPSSYQSFASPPPPTGPAPPLPASPPPPSVPSPGGSGNMPSSMMNLVTLALVNQTAAKKGVAISYSAVPQGPPHQPTWTVRCLINDQERGIGVGKSQKQAKEEAARQAWLAMGW